jgi:hypothetical protein
MNLPFFSSPTKLNVTDFVRAVRRRLEQKCGLAGGKSILFVHDDEIPLLAWLAEQSRVGIVEIGCLYGGSTALILENKNFSVPFTSIDPFVPDSMGKENVGGEKQALRNIAAYAGPLDKHKFRLIADYSYHVSPGWNQPIDLLWLDGDHEYDGVKRDFEEWRGFVASGGRIALHDSRRPQVSNIPESEYDRGWPGPTTLANEIRTGHSAEFFVEMEVGSIVVFQKK